MAVVSFLEIKENMENKKHILVLTNF